jgi:endonuclease/exonuclease/phosphatase family metal-dependent hydrolase
MNTGFRIITLLTAMVSIMVMGECCVSAAPVPVLTSTNTLIRIMACNLTGNAQKYEEPQIRILQGLKPDIVAIQEFNHSNNTPAQIRAFIDTTLGAEYQYYRESSATETYSIPNGIISRYPIMQSGSWDDSLIPDRGFAWARIRIPGSNDLFVVSVHLKASSGYADTRSAEATNLRAYIQAQFPSDAWVIVAGDLNTAARTEAAVGVLATFLSDFPVPSDAVAGGNENTNLGRSAPYDYVLLSFSVTNRLVGATVGGVTFPRGLVFDSRVFSPLGAVPPVQYADSGAGQHMAVLRVISAEHSVTNWVDLAPPTLTLHRDGHLAWTAPAGMTWSVEATGDVAPEQPWILVGTAFSATTNYSFLLTNQHPVPVFYRARYP